jgi:4-amino-4-deoxy-L-arabinose transferase-like glycosyltransferase
MMIPHSFNNKRGDILALTLLFLVLFGIGLGDRPYSAPSEARYIEIGREMAESGDYVTPRLNYVKYFEKPPLFYWVQAGATKVFGVGTFVSRIPTTLFAVALCLITYLLGNTLYGRLAGWLSSFTLATSLYMFALSRIVLLDVPVSGFIVGTLASFLYVAYAPPGRKRTIIVYGMYICAACAVLSKGLIGALLPGAVIFLWLLCTKRWKLLSGLHMVSGILLFLLISVPWHILVAFRNPEFLHFYFIHEHFERYLTTVHGRYQPFWFFGIVFIAGLFPWLVFTAQALCAGLQGFWQDRLSDGKALFLFIWIVFIFFFFSLSDSKLIPYILPIFPPVTVLIGQYFAKVWNEQKPSGFSSGLFILILFLAVIAITPSILPQLLDDDSKVIIAVKQAGIEGQILSVISMIAAGLILIVFIQGRKKHLIISLFVVACFIAWGGDRIASHYNKDSMQEFSWAIESLNQTLASNKKFDKKSEEIVMLENYYQDLPIYLKKRITIVDWKGELEFGTEHENTTAWMIDSKEFWKRWLKADHPMFVIMRDDTYTKITYDKKPEKLHLYLITQNGRNLLFINTLPEGKSK